MSYEFPKEVSKSVISELNNIDFQIYELDVRPITKGGLILDGGGYEIYQLRVDDEEMDYFYVDLCQSINLKWLVRHKKIDDADYYDVSPVNIMSDEIVFLDKSVGSEYSSIIQKLVEQLISLNSF